MQKRTAIPGKLPKHLTSRLWWINLSPSTTLPDRDAINFQLELNDITVQKGNTRDLMFSFDEIIAYVSTFITLKTGDLIFTGTPAGLARLKPAIIWLLPWKDRYCLILISGELH